MKSMNGGYHGFSRSVRSKKAIDNFEVPLSLITKDLVKNFIAKIVHSLV